MRILCLTSRLPYPPDRGDRLRAFNFIARLAQEHELSLVSFIAHESEREHVKALQAYCRDVRVTLMEPRRSATSVLANLWRSEPLQALYYRSGTMKRLVEEVLSRTQFDMIYVHLFRMASYVAGYRGAYRVVDLTDVISQEVTRSLPYRGLAWRLIYRFDLPRIRRYERHVAERFDETWLISETDHRALATGCPAANIEVVTNGVDRGRFYPTGQSRDPDSLLFVGHLGVMHNIDAAAYLARDVLPRVRREVPGASLEIVGAGLGPQVQRLAKEPGVTIAGFVPDLNERLNRAAVFVAPLRFAAGVQNKVLEAMATATPVVTTSMVNEGLGARAGEQVLVADDVETLAGHIVSLLQDEPRRKQIGDAGLELVRQKHTWDHVAQRVRTIEAMLDGRRAKINHEA